MRKLYISIANCLILFALKAGTTGGKKAMRKRHIILNIKALEKAPILKTGPIGRTNQLIMSIRVTFWKTFSMDGIQR